MAEHYNIEPAQTKQFAYPYNMALEMTDVEEKLKSKVLELSEEPCNTGATLFSIPFSPLYRLMNDKNKKVNAQLLLSVCAYLYHIADIPYYRQESKLFILDVRNDERLG